MTKTPQFIRPALAALLAALSVTSAHAMPIAAGSYANTGMGAEFASPYDNLSIDGRNFDVALTGAPMQVSLADYSFEVGPNCYGCSLKPSFDALLDVTIGGVTRQIDLPYAWSSTGPSDSLTFASAAPVRFDFGDGSSILLAIADLGTLTSSGDTLRGHLGATLTVTVGRTGFQVVPFDAASLPQPPRATASAPTASGRRRGDIPMQLS